RCDTHGDFHDAATWEAFDAGGTDGLNTVCYYGAAFDGRYVIFAPRDDSTGYHSRVLRYDTRGPFRERDAWSAHDADLPHSAQGAAFDGRHVYFCPGYESTPGQPLQEDQHSGTVLRMDTGADFHDPLSYRRFDTKVLGAQAVCFDGGAYDGRYVYFVPLLHGIVVRHDTQGDFEDTDSWEAVDAKPHGLGLNVGAVFDGRWLYFCAYGHSSMVRYDTRRPFAAGDSWECWDAAATDGYDGEGGEAFHGRVLRCDTLGADGAFSLRYCDYGHNGGLCAAVPGPSFLVNTDAGVRSIASHHPLTGGRHHLLGTYDGSTLRLWIDGELVASREATGNLVATDVPVTTAEFSGGGARFGGDVERARVLHEALDRPALESTYRDFASASDGHS
ncbi:MAG TPA: hypothetical protein DIC52_22760, partial [Candidatus Latescibacteria bacterium]|nr:hypothetical protein [Candidatus Latescibacterota bacterium]